MLGAACAEILELADEVEQLGRLDLFEGVADLVEGGDAGWELNAEWDRWKSAGIGRCGGHVEVGGRRGAVAILLLVLIVVVGIGGAAVVVAVVHPQRPAAELAVVQIAHCCCRRVWILILQEAEAFGRAGLFVVDLSEAHHRAAARKQVHDLRFRRAIRDVADEHHPSALLSIRHVAV